MKRRKISHAVRAAEPTHLLTLTLAGDDWQVIRRKMRNLRRRLTGKAHGYSFEWVWLVECNTRSGNHHVHALAHGTLPTGSDFKAFATRAGFGAQGSQIEKVRTVPGAVAYLWGDYKRGTDDLAHFLEMNGRRFEHASDNFWRVRGHAMPGWEAAYAAIRDTPFRAQRHWPDR